MRARIALPAAGALVLALVAPAGAGRESGGSRWAYVLGDVAAREAPNADASIVTIVKRRTPEGAPNLVLAVESGAWVRVRLAILPLGTTGWVPRRALGALNFVRTRLVVDRRRLRAVLYRNGVPIFRAPVGVGEPRWPTPRGEFYVRQKLTRFGDPFYGPIAFGTNARSPFLTDWPGGGYVGIHGTDRPELLPGRVSHGCIRMRNADIRRLARLMPLGTPLTIRVAVCA